MYIINICILYRLYLTQNDFLKEELIEYTHANLRHATTFGRRNIAFQIWWLPCNPHKSEWPKTFLGWCMCWWTGSFYCATGHDFMWTAWSTEDSPLVYAADKTFGLPVIWVTLLLMWRHFYVHRFTWVYNFFNHYTFVAELTHSLNQSMNQSTNHRITKNTALGNQRET